MIEFKAECGHTVRAKDEDAGGVVRCSYCGRNAGVPDSHEDDLEFLFRDTGEDSTSRPGIPRTRKRRFFNKRARTSGQFDPYALIIKMCYAAALISIVIVVGSKFVLPLFEDGGLSIRGSKRAKSPVEPSPSGGRRKPTQRRRGGLIDVDPVGMYVGSVPPQALVYLVEESAAPSHGRILGVPGATASIANGNALRLQDGSYAVEVVLPTHYPSLNDVSLPSYEDYLTLRRSIETASDQERALLLDEYFLPDEALRVFIDQVDEVYYIVRQYRNVRVRDSRSKGVRALFLPRIRKPGSDSFSIAQLVADYLPGGKKYVFDDDHVRVELRFAKVPSQDRQIIVDALERIGVMPYVTPDGRTRLFKIDIHDGMCTAKVVREAGE
jgi:hypothetical protein